MDWLSSKEDHKLCLKWRFIYFLSPPPNSSIKLCHNGVCSIMLYLEFAARTDLRGLSLTASQMRSLHAELLDKFANSLTLNIPSLGRQRCLPSWGPRRTPCFFCNFSTVWCGRLLKLCFLGFWNYNSVTQALLVSNILCLFISTEVSQ